MGDFKGLDRTKPAPRGELVRKWGEEIDRAYAELLAKLTCPHCGFLMATGVPCGPSVEERHGKAEEKKR